MGEQLRAGFWTVLELSGGGALLGEVSHGAGVGLEVP